MKKIAIITAIVMPILLNGCATESSRSLEVAKVNSYKTQYQVSVVRYQLVNLIIAQAL